MIINTRIIFACEPCWYARKLLLNEKYIYIYQLFIECTVALSHRHLIPQ